MCSQPTTNEKQQSMRVLIVEDEPLIALSMEDILVGAGFRIAGVAGKLEKALALVEDGLCDAAILDANLGGVSASPVAVALEARGLPFVILSGYSREQTQGFGSEAGFLKKPCQPSVLIEALEAIIKRHHYSNAN
jgi:DNA-binding response OmpR family regulator